MKGLNRSQEHDERCLYLQDVTMQQDELDHLLHSNQLGPRERHMQNFPRKLWLKFDNASMAQAAKRLLEQMATKKAVLFSTSVREDDVVVFELHDSMFEDIDYEHLKMAIKLFAPTLRHARRVSNFVYELIVNDLRDVDHLVCHVQRLEYDGGVGYFRAKEDRAVKKRK